MKNITTFDLDLLAKYQKIYCLVSGGIDSTYLYVLLKEKYGEKVFPVNCFNPYESNTTLTEIKSDPNFIMIKPAKAYDYKEVLRKAFLKLPESRKMKVYGKKIFGCCTIIKHKAFLKNPLFMEPHTVVISGIKKGDGKQRYLWLKSLIDGKITSKGTIIVDPPTFFHIHKKGQTYCYPFRDWNEKELPAEIIAELRIKYPNMNHSGCAICPVLVRFEKSIRKMGNEGDIKRLDASVLYAKSLNVY
jgi:3'-phosphoadenosine 5'-phosphosulfate sulfotransferase (PAPS reductase)/FAD synthetase